MERIDWASLLKRIHGVDVLQCPRCHGRLEICAAVTEPENIRRVLGHLGESATGPPPSRILDPWIAEGP